MSAEYIPHIIDTQAAIEEAFLSRFRSGDYTVEDPLVILNPYKICPLTALIMFHTQKEEAVTVRIVGKYSGTDLVHTFPKAKEHILPVYGLYADYENTVEIALDGGTPTAVKIKTAAYKFNEVHRAILSRAEEGYLDNSLVFMMGQLDSRWCAYDRMGEVRWYTTEPFAFAMRRLENGNLLVGSSRFVADPYMTTGVMEITLCGKILKEYRIPGGYHHDQLELPNHDLVICTQVLDSATKEDVCVLVDRATGEVKRTWDLKDYLPQNVAETGHASAYDWFHNNAVAYDPKTNSLLLSGRHQSAVICIGLDDNKLHWILGTPEGWPQEWRDKYFFTPVGDVENFEWPSEQHSVIVTPDGDIMCFDNGDYRSKNPDKFLKARENYSRGVKYHIDTDKMEIEQVWQYGKERGAEFYSGYIGNVECYGEGHYLIQSGGIAYLNGEVSEMLGSRIGRGPLKQFVKLFGITVVEKDGKIVYESVVPANIYRSIKMHPYTEQERFIPGKGMILGSLGTAEQTPLPADLPDLALAKDLPDEYHLTVKEETDRYDMSGRFHEGDTVRFILAGKEGLQCYGLKTKVAALSMKEGITVMDDGRNYFWRYLNKEGILNGSKLYLYVNGELYKTSFEM